MNDLEKLLARQVWRPLSKERREDILAAAVRATMVRAEAAPGPWWRAVFPAPKICAVFTAAWMALLVAQFLIPSVGPAGTNNTWANVTPTCEGLRAQQQLVAELFGPEPRRELSPAASPRRRTQRMPAEICV